MAFEEKLFKLKSSLNISQEQGGCVLTLVKMIMDNETDKEKLKEAFNRIDQNYRKIKIHYSNMVAHISEKVKPEWGFPNATYKKYNLPFEYFNLFELSIVRGNSSAVEVLYELNDFAYDSWSAYLAVATGNQSVVKYLIDREVEFGEMQEGAYWFPNCNLAQHAVLFGHIDVVKYLFDEGWDVFNEIFETDNLTLDTVSIAIMAGQYKIINFFLEKKFIGIQELDSEVIENETITKGFDILFSKNKADFKFQVFDNVMAVVLQLLLLGVKFSNELHGKNFIDFLKKATIQLDFVENPRFSLNLVRDIKKTSDYELFSEEIKLAIDETISKLYSHEFSKNTISLKEIGFSYINQHSSFFSSKFVLPVELIEELNEKHLFSLKTLLPENIAHHIACLEMPEEIDPSQMQCDVHEPEMADRVLKNIQGFDFTCSFYEKICKEKNEELKKLEKALHLRDDEMGLENGEEWPPAKIRKVEAQF